MRTAPRSSFSWIDAVLWWLGVALCLAAIAGVSAAQPLPTPTPAARLRWSYAGTPAAAYQAKVNGTALPTFVAVTPRPTPGEYEQVQGPIRPGDAVALDAFDAAGNRSADSNTVFAQTWTPTLSPTLTPTPTMTATPSFPPSATPPNSPTVTNTATPTASATVGVPHLAEVVPVGQ